MLFTILRNPKANILSSLTIAQYKDMRKLIILCILATDMAKHAEIISKMKEIAEIFNFSDTAHRHLVRTVNTSFVNIC
jgi:high affinity cGMP-specific 3',5'-cyclic phosphodiesterase 9